MSKPTGELVFFKRLWLEREHKCKQCGELLPIFSVYFFSHTLTKAAFPRFRLKPENIELLCGICHPLWENSKWYIKNSEVFDGSWEWLFEKELKLKREYYGV